MTDAVSTPTEPPAPSHDRAVVEVMLDARGLPCAAAAECRVDAPPARVFALFRDVERYPGRVPMIDKAQRSGSRVHVQLKFKVAVFSTRFDFTCDVLEETDRFMELRWVAGEPRELRIRHDLAPLDGGAATRVRTSIGFDVNSLGWLVKYFLRHHPEIQFGVFSGTALALQHSLKTTLATAAR